MITTIYKVEVDIPESIWDAIHYSGNQDLENTFESMFQTAKTGAIGSGYGWYDGDCTLWAETYDLEIAKRIENRFKEIPVKIKAHIETTTNEETKNGKPY